MEIDNNFFNGVSELFRHPHLGHGRLLCFHISYSKMAWRFCLNSTSTRHGGKSVLLSQSLSENIFYAGFCLFISSIAGGVFSLTVFIMFLGCALQIYMYLAFGHFLSLLSRYLLPD